MEQKEDVDVVSTNTEENTTTNTEHTDTFGCTEEQTPRLDHRMESPPANNELLFLRNQFLPPGWNFLRHHHQQQLLSQWFHKEESDSSLLLLKDGCCQWPGCEKSQLLSKNAFQLHLNNEHSFGQCSAAQAKVQLQIIAQLEQSLIKEKERFHAMMAHLNKGPQLSFDDIESNSFRTSSEESPRYPLELRKPTAELPKPTSHDPSTKVLETENDIMRNRDFYRINDVRPPFTYASLIRQAIIESTDRQLTLNEIYTWFQNNFAYFRRNAATWKNAIRTNLSLHKCFVRYEDDFGSFWTVDDCEFLKRRHLSRGRPRKYDPTTGKFESIPSPLVAPPPNFLDFGRLIASNNNQNTSN